MEHLHKEQQQQQQQQQSLPGYERDICQLIDTFALQAHQEQCISFESFKQLFREGCYAYIHQAYWGCEHSPEYAQLLFAVALDRLDTPSPTAAQDSPLWQLHQLVPKGSASMAAMQAVAGSNARLSVPSQQHLQQQQQEQATGGRLGCAEAEADDGADPMQLDPLWTEAPQPTDMQVDSNPQPWDNQLQMGQHGSAACDPSQSHQQQQQYTGQPSVLQAQPPDASLHHEPVLLQPAGVAQLEAGQAQHAEQAQLQQQRQDKHALPELQQQEDAGKALQQQQQQSEDEAFEQALGGDWLGSPLQPPQQHQGGAPDSERVGLSPSDPVWQLLSPLQQQQHNQGPAATAGLDGLDGFMLPSAALPAGTGSEAQHATAQQTLEQQQQQQQQKGIEQRSPATSADGVLQAQQPPMQMQHAQHPHHQHGSLPEQHEEDEDDFLKGLLAILDEGTAEEDGQDSMMNPGSPNHAQHSTLSLPDTNSLQLSAPADQAQRQRLVLQIPLVVKGAVVFTLLALHESQLIYPKVPMYVPLPLLHQLARAAAEFKAAGAAASDALRAMQQLTSQHRLLVGELRRPNTWEPQLPRQLMPDGRLPCGLGPNTAIGAAARKAARFAAKSAMQSAAVAAAARAARGAAAFDPGVHREALFHIKTALRSLSNFKSLQSLCNEYAGARRAVFEPLLAGSGPNPRGREERQQGAEPPGAQAAPVLRQGHGDEEAGSGAAVGQAAMIVQRGGSRRKRKTAMAAAGGASRGAAVQQQNAGAGQAAAANGRSTMAQQSQQQTSADAAAPAAATSRSEVGVPELFDTEFAAALQGLANREASRMVLLLDPYYNASKVRKRTAEEKRAAKAAEAAAADAARQQLARFLQLTMATARAAGQAGQPAPAAAAAAAAAAAPARKQGARRSSGSAHGAESMQQELVAAGVFTEEDLEGAACNLGQGRSSALSGGVAQALRLAAERRQAKVQVAEQWLRAERAMVVDDGDEDMP